MTGTPHQPPRTAVTIATRGSQLALWQVDFVAGLLARRGITSTKLIVKTTADRIQDRFLHELGGKGLFVKELEQALEEGRADLAVHSLKDMPAVVKAPFTLAAVLERHSPADLVIFRPDIAARLDPPPVLTAEAMAALGPLTIGTGSLRRQAILRRVAPQVQTVGVRGNVDTRLRKLEEGQWEALILAEASLDRLGLKTGRRVSRLATDWFVPCASQGALAIEAREGDPLAAWLGQQLGDPATTRAVQIERGLLAQLGGDCTMPFGCLVGPDGGQLVGRAGLYTREGEAALTERRWPLASPPPAEAMLAELAQGLKGAGASRILAALGLAVPATFAGAGQGAP